ncbi:trigger factor [Desertihabitans aurantiacus]|uniref:trigger factor n=1 Tax=Desertihabitans aurantiacus TaxID=2282477 RepID=UPI000DF76077|nr:trigger factor [Desertihabitans aurantiacus]
MPSTVEELSPNRVKLTVEVPFADLKPSLDKAYKSIADQVTIPGFRKGKVPPMVIDQRFGRGMVLQEAINDALPALYGQAVQEAEINPLGQPEVEVTKLEDGDKIEFTAEVDVRPKFELPDFSAVSVEVDALDVPAEAVEQQLQQLRERFASLNEVERPAAEGDVVSIDLRATRDGEPIEGATADGLTYRVGAGGMLEGLDEAITGLSAGESADFTSTLVGGAARGTEADVHVTVVKVQEQELPELDDDFAQMVSEFDTAEELRADVVKRMGDGARLEQAAKARDAVLEAVVAELDIELPEGLRTSELESRRQQIEQQLSQAGMDLEQYLKESEDAEEAETPEEFWAEVEKRSADALKAQLVLDQVADEREVGVEQDDLTQYIFRRAQQSGSSPEQEMQHMMEHNHLPEWMTEIRRGKALELIVSEATVTDTTGERVELANLADDGSIREPGEEQEQAEDAGSEDAAQADEATAEESTEAR